MSTTPVPILLLGKAPGHLKAVSEIVRPEYEITHSASTVEDAISILPTLLPDSTGQPKIRLVIMGGGFSPADFERVTQVEGARGVPWMRPDPAKMAGTGGGPSVMPSAESVAGRVRECLDGHAEELKEGRGEGEVWRF